MKKPLMTLPLALSLSACSFLFGEDGLLPQQDEETYASASEYEAIKVPADLDSDAIQSNYPIPSVARSIQLEGMDEVPRPAPLTAGSEYDAVRIQRLGDQSWVLVSVPPGQLWPQVRAFLSASNIGVAATDPAAGLIDSQWVKLEDRPLSTRFRFRVDSGVQRNTAELYVLQQDRSPDDSDWPRQSDDLELADNMLRNVAQFIANSADAAPVSMIADRAMGGDGRIEMEEDDTEARLRLELPFDRAWASTNKGLTDAGFAIDDLNRSEGVYYVTYQGDKDEEEQGWFSWLWGSEEKNPLIGRQFQVRMMAASDSERRVYIRIVDRDGAALPRREQQGLLTLLKGNIN